jgi:plastocyanin
MKIVQAEKIRRRLASGRQLKVMTCFCLLMLLISASLGCTPSVTTTTTGGTNQSVSTSQFPGKVWHISIQDTGFDPPKISLSQGDTVAWKNEDDKTHTITSWHMYQVEDGTLYADIGTVWNSGDIKPGDTFSRTFYDAGDFQYLSFPMYLYTIFQGQPIGTVEVG